ncbi:peptidase inhibitor family I36 protein [Streptomyces sp. NPDC004111]|uniref:peptidase inhibitor family I36 protein n=1 Tax=Streptomyces sp. NPDC004111 TaxID=3364690 RepID=UPI00369F1ED1
MRAKKSKFAQVLVTALFTATGLLAAAPVSAQEQAADWHCDRWGFCIYTGDHGDGRVISMKYGVSDLAGVAGGVLDNNVRSVKNISGNTWCLYDRAGYGGELTRILDGYIGPIQWEGIGNRVSSVRAC